MQVTFFVYFISHIHFIDSGLRSVWSILNHHQRQPVQIGSFRIRQQQQQPQRRHSLEVFHSTTIKSISIGSQNIFLPTDWILRPCFQINFSLIKENLFHQQQHQFLFHNRLHQHPILYSICSMFPPMMNIPSIVTVAIVNDEESIHHSK